MRIQPQMDAAAYKTYQVLAPVSTHFRPATCEEVGCEKQTNGFKVIVDESTGLGQRQAAYIRTDKRRKAIESKNSVGLTEFVFEAGNVCFAEHKTRVERPEIYVVKDGDFRGNPRGTTPRIHKNAGDWQEDFALHQQRLHDAHERG